MKELMQRGCQRLIQSDKPNNPRVLVLPSTHCTSHPLQERNVNTDPSLLSINTNPVCQLGWFRRATEQLNANESLFL